MIDRFNESAVEEATLEWFARLGRAVVRDEETSSERSDAEKLAEEVA